MALSCIHRELKVHRNDVSLSSIRRVKESIGKQRVADQIQQKPGPFRRLPPKSTFVVLRKVTIIIKLVNPSTELEMVYHLWVSQPTINRIIKHVLQEKKKLQGN